MSPSYKIDRVCLGSSEGYYLFMKLTRDLDSTEIKILVTH